MTRLPVKHTILACLIHALYIAPAVAAERQTCESESGCPAPALPGKTWQDSLVFTRQAGHTPPSVEYRRPDEVIVLSAPVAAVATREVPVFENRPESGPTVLPQFPSGRHLLSDAERMTLVALAQRLAGKPGLTMRLTGHADVQRMTPETKKNLSR